MMYKKQSMQNKTDESHTGQPVFAGIVAGTTIEGMALHVSPSGDDSNCGTAKKPLKTFTAAQHAARGTKATVLFHEGTYYLSETAILTVEDSGTTYSAAPGEMAVISGGTRLEPRWEPFRDGIMKTMVPAGASIDQIFVNGATQPMARYPNFDPSIRPYGGYAADAFSPERAARWANPAGGFMHALHEAHWGGYHYRITGKIEKGELVYEGGWQHNNKQMGIHPEYRYVENIFEELDAPGEWYHDEITATLYYKPVDGMDLGAAVIEIAGLPCLIGFKGTAERPVRDVTLRGFVFRHAARTFMETREPLLRSDWTIYRGGAVAIEGTEGCTVADCEFDHVGGNAIFVNGYNRRTVVRGCHIHDIGTSGVAFVGDPGAVRSPMFGFERQQKFTDIDQEPGPKSNHCSAECLVEDTLIHSVGRVEKQAAGVQIAMAMDITVRHCSIYDTSRAGINIGDGCWGGHVIEFCDVFDTVQETGDHGSFNSWGRDRYWRLQDTPPAALPSLAKLDTIKPIVLRNNRWRCDHGWDVDLDDGASNYEIYNNLFLRGGLKLREGFHRKVYNNIGINCTLHAHCWYPNSMDVVTGNIWMAPYAHPVNMPNGAWGKEVDRNCFMNEAQRIAYGLKGWDLNSVAGDPMFLDPESGDFRVGPSSPALKIGFINFPMDRFGVQKPALLAMARTPVIPKLDFGIEKPSKKFAKNQPDTPWRPDMWKGALLRELEGMEYSAFGIAKEMGGVVLIAVSPESAAAAAGFLEWDLIQSVDGKPVKSLADWRAVRELGAGQTWEVGLKRSSGKYVLKVTW